MAELQRAENKGWMLSERAQGITTRGSSTLGKDYPESALGQDYFEISYFCPPTKKYSGLSWYVNNRCEKPDGVCPSRIQVTAVSVRKKRLFSCCEKQQTTTPGRDVLLYS